MVMGRLGLVALALVLVVATGCGRGLTTDDSGTPVSWRLASAIEPEATELEIEVVSGSCADAPGPDDIRPVSIDVVETSGTVEITATLGPMPDAVLDQCGHDESGQATVVPLRGIGTQHEVHLDSPLGDRTLVDTACDEKKFRDGSCEHPAM